MLDRNAIFFISAMWIGRPFVGLGRFLAIDGKGAAALIAIPDKTDNQKSSALRRPVTVSLTDLLLQIEYGNVTPKKYTPSRLVLDNISEAESRELEKNKAIIYSLELEDSILFKASAMASLLRKASKMHKVPERKIRRLLYAYYVGGQTEVALVPHFNKKGGPGKVQKLGTGRRGRPATAETLKGRILALPEIREKLKDGVEKHYLPGINTFYIAFVETLKDHFSRDGADRTVKNLVDILLPNEQLPTKWQFLNMIRIVEKEKGKRIAIPGRIRQPDDAEERKGRATDGVLGPGHRFEIDATKLQVQLVSRWSRTTLVGTATLYIVVDVWSSALVGYYFTLENASWRVAASALANTFSEKNQVFERLGLKYEAKDWPCCQLPSMLTGDRAELLADNSIGVPKLGMKAEIAAAMCPEMKGTVESKFKEIKAAHYNLPGSYAKDRKRREKDGKDDAVLTIDEAETILVHAIIAINMQPVSPDRIPPELFEDGATNISRIGLYAWGLKSKPGLTRTMSEDDYKYYLLSPGTGLANQEGIMFKTHVFRPTCSMLEILAMKVSKVIVRYNEHNAQIIYFFNPSSGAWEQAFNMNQNITRRALAFYEWDVFRKKFDSLEDAMRMQNAHDVVRNRKDIHGIIRKAKNEKKEQTVVAKPIKSRRTIRKNKEEEKNALRLEATHQLIPMSNHEPIMPTEIVNRPNLAVISVAALTAQLWEEDE